MGIVEIYDIYWNQKADPRVNNLPFMGSPVLIPLILFSYLYFVLKCGPNFMKDRKPYDLKTFVKFYNVFEIVINAYLVQQFISAGWFTEISVFCEVPNHSYDPGPLKLSYTMWITTMIKLVDLVETAVFVLRKKNRQISFLHLYHHVSTILIAWLVTRYVPVAMASFTMLVNNSVHVIMYSYYFLSTCGENIQKMISPYKPLLTTIQMAQFILLMVHNVQSLIPSCPVTRIPGILSIANLMVNFVLFYNFYRQSYTRSAKKKS